MVGIKGLVYGAVAAVVAAIGIQSTHAAPIVTVLSDTGTLKTDFQGPPGSQSTNSVPSPYGAGSITVTTITPGVAWKVSFNPSSGFFASANNLSGGKTSTFAGLVAFDISFDSAINMTANVFEDGIYSTSGNGRVGVATAESASSIVVTQLDNILSPEMHSNAFIGNAVITPNPTGLGASFPAGTNSGVWTLYDKLTGFSKAYKTYHVVIDNDLLAESLAPNANTPPGFAAIAKKDFSIIFTADGSNGGGPNTPEPASLGILALGGLSLLARRRK